MNSIKRNIPNFITLGNLFCGLVAIVLCSQSNLLFSGFFIFIGATLDFFDGLIARLLKVNSEIGKHLDSMADMTTFGIAPGFIMFQLISSNYDYDNSYMPYLGFIITLFSAIRLARFNIDKQQTSSFIGLPTPAAAIFIAALAINQYDIINIQFIYSVKFLIITSITLSILLISKISLFSLKIKKRENWKSKENIIRIVFLISCVILLFIFEFISMPFIVILYIFLSILNNLTQ